MKNCNHTDCGSKQKVWLPFEVRGLSKGLKPHSYCVNCGAVKSISPEKCRSVGYYINILTSMEKLLENDKITKVQIRLIAKELENIEGFEDTYCTGKENQEKIFVDLVKKYCNFPENLINGFL